MGTYLWWNTASHSARRRREHCFKSPCRVPSLGYRDCLCANSRSTKRKAISKSCCYKVTSMANWATHNLRNTSCILCRTQHSVDARGFIMAHNLQSTMASASNNHLLKELLMLLEGFIPQASLGWPQLISMMVPEAYRRGARAHRLAWIDETHH
jgi:hypothetical protein